EDGAVPGDDGVAPGTTVEHAELGAAVADVAVELDEAAWIEQLLDALAREEFPALALSLDRGLATGVQRLVAQLAQALEFRLRGLDPVVRRGHSEERKRSA